MLCDFLCGDLNLVNHFYAQIMMTLLIGCYLYSLQQIRISRGLWTRYILFAETFKAKINIYSVLRYLIS